MATIPPTDPSPAEGSEAELRQTLLEYEAILQNASVGIIFTRGRKVLHCNPRASEMFGWPHGELTGQLDSVFYPSPDIYRRVGETAIPILSSGNLFDTQFLARTKSGTAFLCRMRAKAINPNSTGVGTIWIAEDITEQKRSQDALLQLALEQKAILDNAVTGIAFLRNRTIVRCNRRLEELFGYDPGELNDAPIRTFYTSDEAYEIGGKPYSILAKGEANQREQIMVRKNGAKFWCRISGRAISPTEMEKGTVWLFEDISDRKIAEEKINRVLLEQKLILDHATVGIVFIKDRRIQRCNLRFEQMLGYGPGELDNKLTNTYYASQETWSEAGPRIRQGLLNGQIFKTELEVKRKDGTLFWCNLIGKAIDSHSDSEGHIWIYEDITERKRDQQALLKARDDLEQRVDERTAELARANAKLVAEVAERRLAEERIRHLAQHDVLTDLPNRTVMEDRLAQAVALAQRSGNGVIVMFIDLDRFKTINDSLGHAAGDDLLRCLATRIKSTVREGDTVSRWGGDEFVVILPETHSPRTAAVVATKLSQCFETPFLVEGRELYVTPSIGISVFPDDGDTPNILIRNADAAMYHAKEMGRNNYQFFTRQMNTTSAQRLQLENDLHRAIDRQEFILHFQPRVNIKTRAMCGYEALVRWQHPQKGLLSSSTFVPLAEETGLIVKIGEWVLRAACEQNRRWQAEGRAIHPIAVNLSARQFRQKNLVEMITRILVESGLDARLLELEITESVLMQHTEETIGALDALSAMGMRISVDDFGTGYSSLAYLKRFPVDYIKIDQSFVRDITTDPEDAAIVSAIVALAHNLRLRSVAEGVETEDQLGFLARCGCQEAQGYYFSEPLPANEFPRFFDQKSLTALGND
ncbi:MAG: EAL domain-containing protein [Burkholderiales bacterium]|nr:EAL domain-containing protein [Burkholderiales bacterium]